MKVTYDPNEGSGAATGRLSYCWADGAVTGNIVARDYEAIEAHGPAAGTSGQGTHDSTHRSRRLAAGFSISRSYAIWISTQVILHFLVITALFEGLFLSQHFIDMFSDHADEVGSLTDALVLVLLTAPEVHFALPVALLTAVYFVVLRCRERRELIVFAGAGLGIRQFSILALLWGVTALLASLLITGIVLPHTRFAFRSDLFAFRNEALAAGGSSGHFYLFPRYTVFKWPTSATGTSSLFIYQTRENDIDRAISVDNATVAKSTGGDALDLRFGDVVVLDIASPQPQADAARSGNANSPGGCSGCSQTDDKLVRLKNYEQAFDLDQLSHLEPRGIEPREWSTMELLGILPPPSASIASKALRKELADRLVRALLAFTAPFLGLWAIGWTTRLTQGFVLPVTCAMVLAIDVVGLIVARALAVSGMPLALAGIGGIFAVILAVALWQIGALQLTLVKPALSKT